MPAAHLALAELLAPHAVRRHELAKAAAARGRAQRRQAGRPPRRLPPGAGGVDVQRRPGHRASYQAASRPTPRAKRRSRR